MTCVAQWPAQSIAVLRDYDGHSVLHSTDKASQVAPPDVDSASAIPQHLLGVECEMLPVSHVF